MSQHLKDAIRDKQALTFELNEIYALVDTSRLALRAEGSDEADCVIDVLSIATERLYLKIQEEKEALKKLEAKQQGGES